MRNHSFIFNEKFCGVAGCPRCRIPATFRCIGFRESGVRSAMFREQALLHCTTLLRGQQAGATCCHSEPPRSGRVEESTQAAEKRLQ